MKHLKTTLIILLTLSILGSILLYTKEKETNYWSPQIGNTLQWQLSAYPIDMSIEADIYDIDLFETPKETITQLHKEGKKVICYINVGAWEDYRDDAELFPKEVLGQEYEGWEGERWLDISNYKLFSHTLEKRFDLAKEKGCDAIEPDNIEGYMEDTGFNITYEEQLEFNIWISKQVHLRNMCIGLKNNPDQVEDLIEHYDWALLEDCHIWNFCDDFKPFIDANKPVFQVEYTDDFCSEAINNKYSGILKNRNLDSWIKFCN